MEKQARDLGQLFPIPLASTEAYGRHLDGLVEAVDDAMDHLPDLERLIGPNNLSVMHDNHRNHGQFLLNVFQLNQPALLSNTIPWVYRAYSSRGLALDYFPTVLRQWIVALGAQLGVELAAPLVAVYEWMLDAHPQMLAASQIMQPAEFSARPGAEEDAWLAPRQAFLDALLRGDHRACLALATERVVDAGSMRDAFLRIIEPSMEEIGRLWERDTISVAQEHLASSIVARVMAAVYLSVQGSQATKGRAVVTAAPGEFHQIGAWMVADLLEMDGWDVRFLGANTPRQDLVELVQAFKPHVVCISITMPFNLAEATAMIADLRENQPEVRVMVGGRTLRLNSEIWRCTGADGYAADADKAVALAKLWWEAGHAA